MCRISVKRIYEPATGDDGMRVLVDRLWPRGIRKDDAKIDLWAKDVAPSKQLREWFHADTGGWEKFCTDYRAELRAAPEILDELLALNKKAHLTLLYASRDTEHNHAQVLAAELRARQKK
ncbi:MAG: DUF488 domain-containing protein [Parvibaculum sp.]|nr:DUF488 domain-containing protein [Parvibaculum sp.]